MQRTASCYRWGIDRGVICRKGIEYQLAVVSLWLCCERKTTSRRVSWIFDRLGQRRGLLFRIFNRLGRRLFRFRHGCLGFGHSACRGKTACLNFCTKVVPRLFLCSARLQATSRAEPGPNRPSWAGPGVRPPAAHGPARPMCRPILPYMVITSTSAE